MKVHEIVNYIKEIGFLVDVVGNQEIEVAGFSSLYNY